MVVRPVALRLDVFLSTASTEPLYACMYVVFLGGPQEVYFYFQ